MRKLLLLLMMLAMAIPIWAGEKTVTISRNEGIYKDSEGVYYCSKDGITMTFSSGMNNINYLVEHQQVIFYIRSDNYVIKKIKFNCLDNTTNSNLDCFYWGPSTMHELEAVATYTPTGTYTYSGYIGTWIAGATDSKDVKFRTEGKPVRFGSVEITYDKEFGDIFDLVTKTSEIQNGKTYVLVNKYESRAFGKEENHGSDPVKTFSSTPVSLLNYDADLNNYLKVKITDEVSLMKLESSGNSDRPWYIKIGDNYLRRRTGDMQGSGGPANGEGWNVYTVSNIPSGSETYFRTSISIGSAEYNNNALIRYSHTSTETSGNKTFAIRHYNGGDLFRVIDYNTSNNQSANNQRVYLYKPAQSYEVTTECVPSNGGYITLGGGILTDDQGKNWSQHFDNVTFFVGPTNGWGVGEVTLTDINSKAVTTLTPTSTSDFGNDYSFEMPANDVKITANFVQPYDIHTVINPNDDSGSFEFIDGYTDFNGQPKSNYRKTVTFKPVAADGYSFTSVTGIDDVTGQPLNITLDADGNYSFEMPGNSVTLTANFEAAHDLYLLGTANGQTAWHPYGPKFTFDAENQVYYIDVYFKGDSLYNYGAGDPYGHFSLSRAISTNPDENTGWGEIDGSRIYATSTDYRVEDGHTYNNCFQTSTDMAFKIPAGVYRITVGKDLDYMSIEDKTTLVFTPAGGDSRDNATVVNANTEVTVTSNLEQLVHDINRNEPSHATFYNTVDNWGSNEHDNTRVISNVGVTEMIANANLGYIKKEDKAYYEIIGDLYLLGTANGETSWHPYGPKFTYDETNQEFYIDVYFKGGLAQGDNADPAYGYFSLTTKIGNDWSDINGSRLFANTGDTHYWVEDGNTYNNCFQTSYDRAFKIKPGVYHITVNRAKTQMTITEYPLSLTFDPVSDSTVAAGDPVNITSNLDQLVHGINANEDNATFTYATSTDGTLPTPNTQGSTVNITAVGATTTVNAQAELGYIVVPGNANYTVPAPTVYNITTQVNPDGSNAGVINAPTGSEANQTVNFTVTDSDPQAFVLTGVEVVDSNNGIVASFEPSADGTYSFTMPNDDVTIHADYERVQYTVTTSWSPADGGAIWLNGVNTPQTVSVANGNQVVFGVAPAAGYELVSITVTNTTTEQEITATPTGNSNEYSFTMPTGNVTISAVYELSDLYMLGTIMGRTVWSTSGPKFTYDPENEQYYLDVYFTGQNGSLSYYDFFALATHVSNADWTQRYVSDTNWSQVTGRLAPATNNYQVDGTSVNVPLSNDPEATGTDDNFTNKFKIPSGVYRVTVNKAKTLMSITQSPLHLYMTPVGGTADNPTIVEIGDAVSISSDMTQIIYAIDAVHGLTEIPQVFRIKDNTMQSWQTGDEIVIAREGITTVDGEISIGFIVVEGSGVYQVNPYNILTQINPDGAGTIRLQGSAADNLEVAGQTVTFNVSSSTGFALDGVQVVINGSDENVPVTQNANGTYSFVMPHNDVTIHANYSRIPYDITTSWSPSEGGAIWLNGVNAPQTISVPNADQVVFSVVPATDYILGPLTVTNTATGQVITATPTGNSNEYTFVMPVANVTIHAVFERTPYDITTSWSPSEGGAIELNDVNTPQTVSIPNADQVVFSVVPATNYILGSLTVTNTVTGQEITATPTGNSNEYTFVMPAADVTITASFDKLHTITTYCMPSEGGFITLDNNIALANTPISFTVGVNSGYNLVDVILSYVDENNVNQNITLTPDEHGEYNFTMPNADVTVTANYSLILPYNIYTDYNAEQGSVTLTGDAADEEAYAGETVTFTVEALLPDGENRHEIDQVYVTINGTDQVVPLTLISSNSTTNNYSFTMPAGDVTVHATFKTKYRASLYWSPNGYGAFRMHVYEQGGSYAGETSHMAGYFEPGTTVLIEVENLWEDDDHGHYTIDELYAIGYDEANEVDVTVISPTDQSSFTPLGNHNYRISFVMPGFDVDAEIFLRAHTTLKFIEGSEYIPNETRVEVIDELIGTWSVKDKLWAKDQVTSFNSTEKDDGAHDYLRNEFPLQKKEWIQNNSVLLIFEDYINKQSENVEDDNQLDHFYEECYVNIEDFVDEYIKAGTIKGTFCCKGMYNTSAIDDTHNHKAAFKIVIDEKVMPEHVDGYTSSFNTPSLGYPGYIPDPREEPLSSEGGFYEDPIMYNYNHYTPSNFCATNIGGRVGMYDGTNVVGPNAPDSLQNKKLFFMNPKDQEIAQVWAVYAGHVNDVTVYTSPRCYPNDKQQVSGDLFTTYEYSHEGGSTFNRYDLTGYFIVSDENNNDDDFDGNGDWQYNRLSTGSRDDLGRPKDDNELHIGDAYLFHVAIEEFGYPVNTAPHAPRREAVPVVKDVPEGGLLLPFKVYPLDLYSPSNNWTTVHEVKSREASEIVSIRYYNVMGQESKTPFDGINIEVIRYKDGSMISNKIYR